MENINVAFNKFWDRKVAELKWISLTIYCWRTSNYIAWCCNLWPLGDLLTKKFSRHSKSSTRKFSRINNFTKPTIDFQQKNKRCVNTLHCKQRNTRKIKQIQAFFETIHQNIEFHVCWKNASQSKLLSVVYQKIVEHLLEMSLRFGFCCLNLFHNANANRTEQSRVKVK